MKKYIWVFDDINAVLSGGVFSCKVKADLYINRYKLTGVLSKYPINIGYKDFYRADLIDHYHYGDQE